MIDGESRAFDSEMDVWSVVKCVDLNSFLGVQSVADVVRRGSFRWFGHLERKSGDDWVSGCQPVEMW